MEYMFNENYEEIRRLFVPEADLSTSRVPPQHLVVFNPDKYVSQLQYTTFSRPEPERAEDTMVVYIAGACRDNGRPNARSGYGVFFGPDSPYNINGTLRAPIPQTSTRAEIGALAHALNAIRKICDTDFKLIRVKIASDSAFLVKAMSEWIERWIENDGIGSLGRPVEHFKRLKELHEKLDDMEYSDDGGIDVQFWHVGREQNREANALANAALDS